MIPVFDLTRQNKRFKKEYTKIFEDVLKRGIFILGKSVAAFEQAFAEYIGVRYAVGVASGTDALTISLLSLNIGPGDEVILPANSYPSSFGVAQTGARIVLVDIDPATYALDPLRLEKAITKRTKAIIPVHMYGRPADVLQICAIAKKWRIPVIEDCAQAVGAEIRMENAKMHEWKKTGSIGTMGCFSFYPTKNLGAFGDGGMVVTNDKHLYTKVRLYRMYGEKSRYKSFLLGRNSRLDELQAAILLLKMKHLPKWIDRRREIAKLYESGIMNHELRIDLSRDREVTKHVYHLFVIRSKRRDELKAYLEKKGIQTAIHYPVPIHLVSSFKHLGYKKGDFPHSERACKEILSLPIYPELTDNEVQYIASAVRQFTHDTTS